MNVEKGITKIIEETGLSKEDIQKALTEKKEELKGLISDEGALFIIAKEFGVDLKITPPKDKEPETKKGNWMEELANIEIGKIEVDEQELKIAKGYQYTFKMVDSRAHPEDVKDVFMGKESKQTKKQFLVKLIGVAPSKKMYAELLETEREFVFKWVNGLKKGNDYKWKISKSAAKQFAQFCLDEQINDDSIIRYTRFGDGNTTTYEFKKLGKKD